MTAQTARPNPSFWTTFQDMTLRPYAALRDLAADPAAARKGAGILLLATLVYTFILGVFILRGYPAAAPSILPLSVEEQYPVQVFYQGPLFFLATLAVAAVLVLFARLRRQNLGFGLAFARLSFATTLPFVLTTMLVETVVAGMVLAGVWAPVQVVGWLTGPGAWFAAAYQLAGLVWIAALATMAVQASLETNWPASALLALVLLVVYGLPVGLLIR